MASKMVEADKGPLFRLYYAAHPACTQETNLTPFAQMQKWFEMPDVT